MAKKKNKIYRYVGWLLLPFLAFAWLSRDIGPMTIVVVSVCATLYFLFAAPLWCNAQTRANTFCRNNSHGLLVGCYLRNHKWQNVILLIHVSRWRQLVGKLFDGVGRQAATISALAGAVSAIVAVVALALS